MTVKYNGYSYFLHRIFFFFFATALPTRRNSDSSGAQGSWSYVKATLKLRWLRSPQVPFRTRGVQTRPSHECAWITLLCFWRPEMKSLSHQSPFSEAQTCSEPGPRVRHGLDSARLEPVPPHLAEFRPSLHVPLRRRLWGQHLTRAQRSLDLAESVNETHGQVAESETLHQTSPTQRRGLLLRPRSRHTAEQRGIPRSGNETDSVRACKQNWSPLRPGLA